MLDGSGIERRVRAEHYFHTHRALIDDIRLLLLTDRSEDSDEGLGLFKDGEFSATELVKHLTGKPSNTALREALYYFHHAGLIGWDDDKKTWKVFLIHPEDKDRIHEVRYEIIASGHSAIERFAEIDWPESAVRHLAILRPHLDSARRHAVVGTVHARGAAVLDVTEVFAAVERVTNAGRAGRRIRIGLDAIENALAASNAESFSPRSLAERIAAAEAIAAQLEIIPRLKKDETRNAVSIAAQEIFSDYLDALCEALSLPELPRPDASQNNNVLTLNASSRRLFLPGL